MGTTGGPPAPLAGPWPRIPETIFILIQNPVFGSPSFRAVVRGLANIFHRIRAPLVVLGLAIIVGTWLRFRLLGETALYGDGAEYAMIARNLIDEPFRIYYSLNPARDVPFVSQPPFVLYMMAIGLAILPDPTMGAKMVPAAFGVLGVLAVYLLGREARGPWTGAIGAALVAITPMHVHVSRIVLLDIPLATMATFAAWLTLRLTRTRTVRDAIFLGLAIGATVLAKLPGILIPAFLLAFVVLQLVRERFQAPSWKEWIARTDGITGFFTNRAGLIRVGAASGIVVVLVAAYLAILAGAGSWDAWTAKLEWQLGRVSGDIHQPTSPFNGYLVGEDNLLDRVGAPIIHLGIAGIVVALVRYVMPRGYGGRPGDLLIPLLAIGIFLFFSMSARKMWFYMTPLLPFLLLAAGDLLATAGKWAANGIPWPWRAIGNPRTKVAPVGVAAMALIAVAAPGVTASATDAMAFTTSKWHPYGGGYDEVCAFIRTDRAAPHEGVMGSLLNRYAIRYYCPDVPVYDRFRSDESKINLVASGRGRYLVEDPYHRDHGDGADYFDRLRSLFPHVLVASFGQIEVYEFRPTNLTVDVAPSQMHYPRGANAPFPSFTVTIHNPATAPAAVVGGRTMHVTVEEFTPEAWPFDIQYIEVLFHGPPTIAPGETRIVTFDWPYDTIWNDGWDTDGKFQVEVRWGGEMGLSPKFTVALP